MVTPRGEIVAAACVATTFLARPPLRSDRLRRRHSRFELEGAFMGSSDRMERTEVSEDQFRRRRKTRPFTFTRKRAGLPVQAPGAGPLLVQDAGVRSPDRDDLLAGTRTLSRSPPSSRGKPGSNYRIPIGLAADPTDDTGVPTCAGQRLTFSVSVDDTVGICRPAVMAATAFRVFLKTKTSSVPFDEFTRVRRAVISSLCGSSGSSFRYWARYLPRLDTRRRNGDFKGGLRCDGTRCPERDYGQGRSCSARQGAIPRSRVPLRGTT